MMSNHRENPSSASSNGDTRRVRLLRDRRSQLVEIPRDYELPGDNALIRREGARLVIVPLRPADALSLLAAWEPLPADFPDVDEDLPPINTDDTPTPH